VSVDPDDPMRKFTLDQILACRILTKNGFENIFLAPGRQAQNGTNAEKAFVIAGCSGFFVQKNQYITARGREWNRFTR